LRGCAPALEEHGAEAHLDPVREELLEIIESPWCWQWVAVATGPGGGYEAAQSGTAPADPVVWDPQRGQRVEAGVAATEGGPAAPCWTSSTFNTWIQAKGKRAEGETRGHLCPQVSATEYRVAFDAWLKTETVHQSKRTGRARTTCPEYHTTALIEQVETNSMGGLPPSPFSEGTQGAGGPQRITSAARLLLATVLFLIALSQRFKLAQGARRTFLVVAGRLDGIFTTGPRSANTAAVCSWFERNRALRKLRGGLVGASPWGEVLRNPWA